jgi:hypothetical protein
LQNVVYFGYTFVLRSQQILSGDVLCATMNL